MTLGLTLLVVLCLAWMLGVRAAATLLVPFLVLVVGLFAALYFFRSNWRATLAGRALLYSKLSLLVLSSYGATVLILDEFPARDWVRLTVYLVVALTQLNLLLTFIRVQNERERSR
ncbi:putative phage holin [Hoyosella altamirensis]|uniref:putative phage holin n=2 Tax=Hoyosella altamirensis TaxID=616997 RepID=UPI0012EDF160|nr:hypothetical protein [Hoyosella altamirensis]